MPTKIINNKMVMDFSANRLQHQFIESRAKADLFSSRVGEGKSTALVMSAYYHTVHNPGAEWAFIRDTWENIQRTTLKTFFEWFPQGHAGTWHATKKQWTWAEGLGKGHVTFIGMDDPTDASKLLSWELAGIAIDEPAPAAGSKGIDEMVFDLGLTRLRQSGMNWYAMKLATNNPDETHWTYRKFAGSDKQDGFQLWQPSVPENMHNLPANYYEEMRKTLQHRPDLIRRFIDGEFGFQQEGAAVTPQWNDRLHLAIGLSPQRGRETYLCWDFGHNPTCIVTQRTPLGYWYILDSMVGEDIGVEELIEDQVKPLLNERYRSCPIKHIGDPAGNQREQTSIKRSAVRYIKESLGGTWRSGPIRFEERKNPMQACLSRTIGGTGMVQVDRDRASHVWHALRGGWYYHKAANGVVATEPRKNIHSHPGDAISYGAAVLFPMHKFLRLPTSGQQATNQPGGYFGAGGNNPTGPKIGPRLTENYPTDKSVLGTRRDTGGYF